MTDLLENSESNIKIQSPIVDGTEADLELLPKDLGMPPRDESKVADDLQITLGPLEFDYSQIKQDGESITKTRWIGRKITTRCSRHIAKGFDFDGYLGW